MVKINYENKNILCGNRGKVNDKKMDDRKIYPSITITTTYEDNSESIRKSIRKISITNIELLTLKAIYNNIMLKKCPDIFIESSLYKNLMERNLVKFSQTYRNVILSDISKSIIESKKESGRLEIEGEEKVIVEWKGF